MHLRKSDVHSVPDEPRGARLNDAVWPPRLHHSATLKGGQSVKSMRRLPSSQASRAARSASINAAAKASGINYRTAQRIVEGAAEHRELMAVS